MLARVVRFLIATFKREPWYAEFWSGLVAVLWAALSWGSPADMERWPSMAFLLRIAPDAAWQAAGLVLGGVQLVALMGDWRWFRWGAAILMCWWWSLLTAGVWIAVPWAPGVVVYAGWAGINVFSILRLLRHHA